MYSAGSLPDLNVKTLSKVYTGWVHQGQVQYEYVQNVSKEIISSPGTLYCRFVAIQDFSWSTALPNYCFGSLAYKKMQWENVSRSKKLNIPKELQYTSSKSVLPTWVKQTLAISNITSTDWSTVLWQRFFQAAFEPSKLSEGWHLNCSG